MDILGCEFRLTFTSPSGLCTRKVKRFRNVSVTNIHVSLLSYHASEGVTSLSRTYEQIIWRQYSEIENSVTETRFSDINRTMLLKCVFLTAYQLNCFYRAMRADCFFERSHFLITLTSSLYYLFLQIPAEQQNCTSSTWDIFKPL